MRQAQPSRDLEPFAIGIDAQRRLGAVFLRVLLFALLAVDGQTNADRLAHDTIAEPQLFALDIDRLFAAIRAVADDAFASHVRRHVNFVIACAE